MNCQKCGSGFVTRLLCTCLHVNVKHAIETENLKVLGITGRAGSGKSTFAKFVKDQAPNALVLPFAAKVKEIAKSMGWDGEKDEKGRRLLQLIGTECGRECVSDDVWVDLWYDTLIKTAINRWPLVVIADDVRFDNEAAAIKALGGSVIKLTGRNNGLGTEHKSEQSISNDLVDVRIDNSDGIQQLRQEAAKYGNFTRRV